MRGKTGFEIVERCRNCYGDSPKACKREQIQPMFDSISEYQWAYRRFQAQKKPKSMKPVQKKIEIHENWQTKRDRISSVYSKDYVCPKLPKRIIPFKHKQQIQISTDKFDGTTEYSMIFYPKVSLISRPKEPGCETAKILCPSIDVPDKNDTIYTDSYPSYDAAKMLESNPNMVKAKDNLAIPEGRLVEKSTAQDDFVEHENAERPAPILPRDNTPRPTEPIETSTEYNDSFSGKPEAEPTISPVPRYPDITTTMADFPIPKYVERPKPFIPTDQANLWDPQKFDETTTFKLAYQPPPVKRHELPVWAKKPMYKRPEGSMVKTTEYQNEFRNPGFIKPPAILKPHPGNREFLRHFDRSSIEAESVPMSMYKDDFRLWENARPRESYKVIEQYQEPTERMIFETNHMTHYQGITAEKMKPCRNISEHRKLNVDTPPSYITSYSETYKNVFPRPKTTPAPSSTAHATVKGRPGSAKTSTPMPAISNKIPTPKWKDHTNKIPTTEWKAHTNKIPTTEWKAHTNKIPTTEGKAHTNNNNIPTTEGKAHTNKILTPERKGHTDKILTPEWKDHTAHLMDEKTPIRRYRDESTAQHVTKVDILKIDHN